MANQNKLKAWVRYDGTNTVVTAGPIFRASKPKVGNWKQINADLCCNGSITTTTTTTNGGGGVTPTPWLIRVYFNETNACQDIQAFGSIGYTASNTIEIGTTVWADAALTVPFDTQSFYIIKFSGNDTIYTITQMQTTYISGTIFC